MSIETKSQSLKAFLAGFDTQWFLGNLSWLMSAIADRKAQDQLGRLSSPLRQLYFLGGLLVSLDPVNGNKIQYTPEEWNQIIDLLNEIEIEYDKLFFPKADEEVNEEWRHIREVAMPSFLSYFNQGPLNYEEQTINWVTDLFTPFNPLIEGLTGLKTEDFLQFYENLDRLHQNNFQSHTTKFEKLRPNWDKYSKLIVGTIPEAPDFIKKLGEEKRPLYTFMTDHGIIDRFYPKEIVTASLPIEKVHAILKLLSITRTQTDFLYYTASQPGNPLTEKPIINIGDGLFQVFEVKQVIHAIENLLEQICSSTQENSSKYVEKKGKLLEARIVDLFKTFFVKDYEFYTSYYVDGKEQDILFLWKEFAFIIEAKGYNIREPFRDPNKAFVRIKDDFNACIGYGHKQTTRVEKKFINMEPLRIEDKNGNLIKEVDTTKYENNDFSVIVNIKSFGQIQNNLATLLKIDEGYTYPWVVKIDDLEVFLLTLLAQKRSPIFFINYLLLREELHGKLFCSDELEVCGGYILEKINHKLAEKKDKIATTPDLASLFDKQYYKGMGFKNEKYLIEKRSGKYMFW